MKMKFKIICPECKSEDVYVSVETEFPPPDIMHFVFFKCNKCNFQERVD